MNFVKVNDQNNKSQMTTSIIRKGISFGSCLAMIISYTAYHSIGWAIIHGCLSWIYVIYYLIKHAPGLF